MGRSLRHADPLIEAERERYRLRRQWVVMDRAEPFDRNWPSIALNDRFVLRHHPDTRILTTTRPADGAACAGAVLIGVAVSTVCSSDELASRFDRLAAADHADRVAFLQHVAGTYVAIWHTAETVALYTDPAGMLQVFHREGRAASSPALLGDLARDHALDAQYRFGGANDWYPGTLTPFPSVQALLANHVLDLDSGVSRRFWPATDPQPVAADHGTALLAEQLRTLADHAVDTAPLLCSLTGGKDSRVSLAALRERRDEVEFFTIRAPGVAGCDLHVPATLRRRFDLDHRFVDHAEPADWLLEVYDEMTCGLSIGGRRAVVGAAAAVAGPDYVHLNGNLGALAKSYFWPSPNPGSVRPTALAKEFAARPPAIRAGVEQWLASVPELRPTTVYNLMYLEQRGGRWMGIGETASCLFYDSLSLFSSREVFETINRLPTRTQYGGTLLVDLVGALWPELQSVAYCRSRRNWSTYLPRGVKNRAKALIARSASAAGPRGDDRVVRLPN